ncbi:hypothetical protein [Clostridium tagluense]|uniref:hypothetical protein n=1 Tax=Clostridium tagluense TaxID=360422 RepID=UPI001CF14DDC|nr:hypothetical protein [Clostridium tagluense]MCB2300445.1 hypothetical protein [Clostridium tagluense]
MKITAEFNSNEELLSFLSTFGAKNFMPGQGATTITNVVPVVETKKTVKSEDKPIKETKVDAPKEEIKENAETNKETNKETDDTEKEEDKETKVTKEMVRERLGIIMKAGKQKEAKDLLATYSANKLPELKEEHYAAVYEEAEALL